MLTKTYFPRDLCLCDRWRDTCWPPHPHSAGNKQTPQRTRVIHKEEESASKRKIKIIIMMMIREEAKKAVIGDMQQQALREHATAQATLHEVKHSHMFY